MTELEDLLHGEQLKKAILQDRVMEIIADSVRWWCFHGGTAVWRCYGGKRFSKDIDLYMKKNTDIKKTTSRLKQAGFKVEKDSERRSSLFYTVRNSTDISLQINRKQVRGGIATYAETDGIMLDVYALSPEELIEEKIGAYSDRRLERDLYDIKVLVAGVADRKSVAPKLSKFLNVISRPKDEGALRGLVYEGIIPNFDEMVTYLKRWCSI